MGEIKIEKKNSFPWWIWIVVGLIVVAILFFLLGGDNQNTGTDDSRNRQMDQEDTVRRQPTSEFIPNSEGYILGRVSESRLLIS
ncbi:hypothetical protein [Anditalea andensis]|uniref:Uncharacterized protein n=1 Tax=Anditalea andensis TaxID=1048983 RepID=A0A074LD95_9BACT|nr:hypothetical protein [Anditalea andensis]KEO71757.1 hypothetical protein EL17_21465 [Anditalea andensis]